MDAWEIVIQLIGYIGLMFAVLAFQCRSHKMVMLFRTLNEIFFAVQYFCLGSYTGVIMNVIGSVRNISFSKCVEAGRSTKLLQILFCILFLILGLLTTNGWMSIIVILAKMVTTVAYSMKNTSYIRLLTLPTSTCWLIYNASCGSTAGILSESFTIVSIVIGIVRLDLKALKQDNCKRSNNISTKDKTQ